VAVTWSLAPDHKMWSKMDDCSYQPKEHHD
jgi:hypothetical protein